VHSRKRPVPYSEGRNVAQRGQEETAQTDLTWFPHFGLLPLNNKLLVQSLFLCSCPCFIKLKDKNGQYTLDLQFEDSQVTKNNDQINLSCLSLVNLSFVIQVSAMTF
jgi:hypothetical protein